MTNCVFESLRLEQSQIDTLLEVIADDFRALDKQEISDVSDLASFEDLHTLHLDDIDADAVIEKVRERINEAVLEISTTTTKRILLGCGGPTRYIEIDFDGDGCVDGGRYFDNAGAVNAVNVDVERTLNVSEAQAFADRYCLGEC